MRWNVSGEHTAQSAGKESDVRGYKQLYGLLVGLMLSPAIVLAVQSDDLRLIDALRKQDTAAARQLLGKVDPNVRQGDGATALHWAAHWNNLDLAKQLIQAGADVNVANDNGVSPLYLACMNASAPMAEVLLGAGADPNAASLTGETPLMTATRTGSLEVVDKLLARGARVNVDEHVQEHVGAEPEERVPVAWYPDPGFEGSGCSGCFHHRLSSSPQTDNDGWRRHDEENAGASVEWRIYAAPVCGAGG